MSENKVTDEMLARYLEGRANEEETRLVLAHIAENEEEFEMMKIAAETVAFLETSEKETDADSESDNKKHESVYGKSIFPKENLDDDTRYQLADHGKVSMAAANTGVAKSCAIQAQQLILQDFGIDVSQAELTEIARKNGWYIDSLGSPMDYVGELLNYFDVSAVQMRNANIYNLMYELSQGHKIIVGVDANDLEQSEQWRDFDAVMSGKEANHVLVVAGIDTSDPKNIKVSLTDPTNAELKRVFPAKQFMDAWEESGYFMVATQKPAPLNFNVETMCNFDYQRGYVEKFADMAYAEIIKRLEQNGLAIEKKWSKILRYLIFCLAIPGLVLGGAVLAWRYYTPIDMKIIIQEDENFKIPDMPFENGNLTVSYSSISPLDFKLNNHNQSVTVEEINYKYKNEPIRIQFYSKGYLPIDTTVNITKKIDLPIRRDNSLGTIFGFVQDEDGNPIADALVSVQDITARSDINGKFSISIPYKKQKTVQSVNVQKEGFQTWILHGGKPSETECWYIILRKSTIKY